MTDTDEKEDLDSTSGLVNPSDFGRYHDGVLFFKHALTRRFKVERTLVFLSVPVLATERVVAAALDSRQAYLHFTLPAAPAILLYRLSFFFLFCLVLRNYGCRRLVFTERRRRQNGRL